MNSIGLVVMAVTYLELEPIYECYTTSLGWNVCTPE